MNLLDYTYLLLGTVGEPLYYRTFIDTIGKNTTDALVAILPDNCEGYDSILYTTYFTISDQTSGMTAGKYAVAFMDAVKELPDVADRFDKLTVEKAILTYNALQAHASELAFITDDTYFARYEKAVNEYYVNITENLISHLFDMAPNEYSFNAVKSALTAYNSLSDAQRANVTNSDKLTEKIAEINAVFGREIDFGFDYEDNLPVVVKPIDDKMAPWAIVLMIFACVFVLASGAVLAISLLKKRDALAEVAEGPMEECEVEPTTETEPEPTTETEEETEE